MKKYIISLVITFLVVATFAVAKDNSGGQPFKAILDAINNLRDKIDNIKCSPYVPVPIPKTGQTTTWIYGDDGSLQRGIGWPNPRFADNEDGTVTDNLTGLIWLKDANCFGQKAWDVALSDCNGLTDGSCGLTDSSTAGDWRLPNIREFLSIIDYGKVDPALPSGYSFQNVKVSSVLYWTSTTDQTYYPDAWFIHMLNGYVYNHHKSSNNYVWCVRGGY